jgi:uncharacterized SAM-binding protein YcdF (DUF218 family)
LFFVKKIISQLLYPLNFSLFVLLVGVALIWMKKSRLKKFGRALASIGALLLLVCSYFFIADALLYSLEYAYPALPSVKELDPIEWVVVLGGGHTPDEKLSETARLSSSSISRLVEGIRIVRQIPGSRLVLSGGAIYHSTTEAKTMQDAAVSLGITPETILLETQSKDTADQAANIRKIVGNAPFIMVTSASHMRRSVGMFRHQGLQPIPAPTDYWVKADHALSPVDFFPSPDNLRKLQIALHEYMGIGWAKIRGQL